MTITTAEYKAAIEAKIAAASGATSLKDLTLLKTNSDLWLLNNSGGSVTGYAALEALIQTKQNSLAVGSSNTDLSLVGVSAFPPDQNQQTVGGVYSPDEFVHGAIASGASGTLLTVTPELDECVCLHVLVATSASQPNFQVEFGSRILIPSMTVNHTTGLFSFASFVIGGSFPASSVDKIIGRPGEPLVIKKTTGSINQNVQYVYSIGKLL